MRGIASCTSCITVSREYEVEEYLQVPAVAGKLNATDLARATAHDRATHGTRRGGCGLACREPNKSRRTPARVYVRDFLATLPITLSRAQQGSSAPVRARVR